MKSLCAKILMSLLIGSWHLLSAMEKQFEQSDEIALARVRTQLELGRMHVENKTYEKAVCMEVSVTETDEIALSRTKCQLELGCLLLKNEKYEKARKCFMSVVRDNVDQNSVAAAAYYVGFLYEYGLGVEKELSKALAYYLTALNQRENSLIRLKVAAHLGQMYFLGLGVEKNYVRAREYYAITEDQNHDELLKRWSRFQLGNIYAQGLGVEKNVDRASAYYDLILQDGGGEYYRSAKNNLDELLKEEIPQE